MLFLEYLVAEPLHGQWAGSHHSAYTERAITWFPIVFLGAPEKWLFGSHKAWNTLSFLHVTLVSGSHVPHPWPSTPAFFCTLKHHHPHTPPNMTVTQCLNASRMHLEWSTLVYSTSKDTKFVRGRWIIVKTLGKMFFPSIFHSLKILDMVLCSVLLAIGILHTCLFPRKIEEGNEVQVLYELVQVHRSHCHSSERESLGVQVLEGEAVICFRFFIEHCI